MEIVAFSVNLLQIFFLFHTKKTPINNLKIISVTLHSKRPIACQMNVKKRISVRTTIARDDWQLSYSLDW